LDHGVRQANVIGQVQFLAVNMQVKLDERITQATLGKYSFWRSGGRAAEIKFGEWVSALASRQCWLGLAVAGGQHAL
jgi:hypothetical protein